MKNIIVVITAIFAFTSISSCRNEEGHSDENEQKEDSTLMPGKLITEEELNQLILTIPPPTSIFALIKQKEENLNPNILNSTDNVHKYNTPLSKALNIGTYGTDLVYVNVYDKTLLAMGYIDVTRDLSKEVDLNDFFSMKVIKEMSQHRKNADSLLSFSINNFKNINSHLYKQNKEELSLLIVIGGWIECLNIMCQTTHSKNIEELNKQIINQHTTLDSLIKLTSLYDKNLFFISLTKDFQKLKSAYLELENTNEYGHPKNMNNSTAFISITDLVFEIRNKLTHN